MPVQEPVKATTATTSSARTTRIFHKTMAMLSNNKKQGGRAAGKMRAEQNPAKPNGMK